jgi:hypothetical protein
MFNCKEAWRCASRSRSKRGKNDECDIVGSTEKAAALGDHRWRYLLDHHHATIRGCEIKPTGDGMLATFDGPAREAISLRGQSDGRRRCGIGGRRRIVGTHLHRLPGIPDDSAVRRGGPDR